MSLHSTRLKCGSVCSGVVSVVRIPCIKNTAPSHRKCEVCFEMGHCRKCHYGSVGSTPADSFRLSNQKNHRMHLFRGTVSAVLMDFHCRPRPLPLRARGQAPANHRCVRGGFAGRCSCLLQDWMQVETWEVSQS